MPEHRDSLAGLLRSIVSAIMIMFVLVLVGWLMITVWNLLTIPVRRHLRLLPYTLMSGLFGLVMIYGALWWPSYHGEDPELARWWAVPLGVVYLIARIDTAIYYHTS